VFEVRQGFAQTLLALLNELRLPLRFFAALFLSVYEVDRDLLDAVRGPKSRASRLERLN
jgi:hypothetical protein